LFARERRSIAEEYEQIGNRIEKGGVTGKDLCCRKVEAQGRMPSISIQHRRRKMI